MLNKRENKNYINLQISFAIAIEPGNQRRISVQSFSG